jgi:glycerol-3-phosphate dehydrogenase
MKKLVAVLGGGHGAHAMAVDLSSRGFSVNMYEMPQFKHHLQALFATRTIEASGEIRGQFEINNVTSDIEDAIDGVKYILLVTPAFDQEFVLDRLKGALNQIARVACRTTMERCMTSRRSAIVVLWLGGATCSSQGGLEAALRAKHAATPCPRGRVGSGATAGIDQGFLDQR